MVGASERCDRNEGTKHRKEIVRKLFEEATERNVTVTEQTAVAKGTLDENIQ